MNSIPTKPIKIVEPEKLTTSNPLLSKLAIRTILELVFYIVIPVVSLCLWLRNDNESFMAGFILTACFFVFVTVVRLIDNHKIKQRQIALRKAAMVVRAKRRARESVAAQLAKPAFDARLQRFTGTSDSSSNKIKEFKSHTNFWQANELQLEPKPARPMEFFRVLLQRISKLVTLSR